MSARGSSPRLLAIAAIAAIAVATLLMLVGTAGSGAASAATNAARDPRLPQCSPSQLSPTLDVVPVGSGSTSRAGAIVFTNTSSHACTLNGVPTVHAVTSSGQPIPLSQAPMAVRHGRPVSLAASHSSSGAQDAGVSITWSDWTCAKGSFALDVTFPGWTGSVTAPYGTTTGYAGAPCTSAQQTLYVGPVGRAAAPA